jgi:hypothetical protein
MIVHLFQVILLFILLEPVSFQPLLGGYGMQSQCVQSAIGNTEILATRSFDVDKDGKLLEFRAHCHLSLTRFETCR